MVNEFDVSSRYYHLYGAEAEMRHWAARFSNSYLVCIFACCREIFNKFRHSGCYGGSQQEAKQAYKEEFELNLTNDLNQSTENQIFKSQIANLKLKL